MDEDARFVYDVRRALPRLRRGEVARLRLPGGKALVFASEAELREAIRDARGTLSAALDKYVVDGSDRFVRVGDDG